MLQIYNFTLKHALCIHISIFRALNIISNTLQIRVDHISKSVSNVDSKLFIPFQYIRIYTKKIFSHIGTDLGVPQGGSNFTKGLIRANMSKTRKWPYLAWFSSKLKNKTTFFSSTLKVWQNKVVLFFHFKPKWARYGHFLVLKFLI